MKEKFKRLAADGLYGDPICGYSDHGQVLKEQFLRDARALLKQAGKILARIGWTECDIRVNPAGPAVSGDVHADFWKPDDPLNTVYCTISASCVAFGGRKDGVLIMARKEKREVWKDGRHAPSNSKVSYRNVWMGINQWIDPGMNSQELADQLLKIAGLQEAERAGMLAGCAYHSHTAGSLSIPSAIIRNREEADALKEAYKAVITAAHADASVQNGGQPPTEAVTGLHQMTLFESFEMQEA
jgi:hypothetical protein